MGRIAHTFRRKGGTYVVRKRLPCRSFGSRPITLSLGTKDPCLARIRAPAVCAALDWAVAMVEQTITLNGGARSASETARLVRAACDIKLQGAIADHQHGHDPDAAAANVAFGDYYDLAARHGGVPQFTVHDDERLRAAGRTETQIAAVRRLIKFNTGDPVLSDKHLQLQLQAIGFSYASSTARSDRFAMLTGWARAQYLAPHLHDPQVQATADPAGCLLDHWPTILSASASPRPDKAIDAAVEPTDGGQRRTADAEAGPEGPLMSEVIDAVVNDIISRGHWKAGPHGTGEQARRLIKQMIWTRGDRAASAVDQVYLSSFLRDLYAMPSTVRVQLVWHEPYEVASGRFPTLTAENTRSGRSINNNLAYLSTFSKAMIAAGYWSEGQVNPLALAHKVTKAQKRGARPPWTVAHLEQMFSSPIYLGNAGPKRRLKPGQFLLQDAAYWVLALSYFTGCRENEACGLLTDEVIAAGTRVPHAVIQPNDLRGLKTESSERVVPLHPRLLELGFLDYVEAIKSQGHRALFQELWLFAAKRGADQYRSICWDKIIRRLRAQPGFEVPCGTGGKKADFHSVRSTTLSQLDRAGIDQNIVKDIAGHAREGVTAQTYQDLIASGGLEEVLVERLTVLQRLPDPTRHLTPPPLQFVTLAQRTR